VAIITVAVKARMRVPQLLAESLRYLGIAALGTMHAGQAVLLSLSLYMAAHVLVQVLAGMVSSICKSRQILPTIS
jgi:branched-subunit amino acid transport protein